MVADPPVVQSGRPAAQPVAPVMSCSHSPYRKCPRNRAAQTIHAHKYPSPAANARPSRPLNPSSAASSPASASPSSPPRLRPRSHSPACSSRSVSMAAKHLQGRSTTRCHWPSLQRLERKQGLDRHRLLQHAVPALAALQPTRCTAHAAHMQVMVHTCMYEEGSGSKNVHD